MSELFQGPVTVFDFVVLAVVIISAVMSLSRGFIREISSVISFVVGVAVAWLGLKLLNAPLQSIFPSSWPTLIPSLIIIVIGFVLAYGLAAFLGGRMSRLVQSSPEISWVDRIAGAVFGVLRGLLAAVIFILLLQQVLPDDAIPSMISRSFSYDILGDAAETIRNSIPGFVERASSAINAMPVDDPTSAN